MTHSEDAGNLRNWFLSLDGREPMSSGEGVAERVRGPLITQQEREPWKGGCKKCQL